MTLIDFILDKSNENRWKINNAVSLILFFDDNNDCLVLSCSGHLYLSKWHYKDSTRTEESFMKRKEYPLSNQDCKTLFNFFDRRFDTLFSEKFANPKGDSK